MRDLPILDASRDVVRFWAAARDLWFSKDAAFDAVFRERFAPLYGAARQGLLDDRCDTPEGSLALAILLDQYPRNAFRGTTRMYEADTQVLTMMRSADDAGHIASLSHDLRLFLILPFAHSEVLADQDCSVALHDRYLDGFARLRARRHRLIIRCFGRFPHRNALLGRKNTLAERLFLRLGGFSG